MHRTPATQRHRLRAIAVVAALLLAVAVAGCGLEPGADPGTRHALLNVTTGFGSRTLGTSVDNHIDANENDLTFTQRHFKVTMLPGGRYVQSIDGVRSHNFHVKWELYVNGTLAGKTAARTKIHQGDHVWWDLQNWLIAQPKAVVGAYPEPFTTGTSDREAPTLLECGQSDRNSCDIVGTALRKVGLKPGIAELGGEQGPNSNTVLVGNWTEVRRAIISVLIAAGPAKSGVFGRFTGKDGFQLENPEGDLVKTIHGSIGLIAAVQNGTQTSPAWLVTGNDAAAVKAAARHLNAASLHNHFAVVIYKGRVIPLPLVSG